MYVVFVFASAALPSANKTQNMWPVQTMFAPTDSLHSKKNNDNSELAKPVQE